jgi:hypothetical protein
MERGSGTLEGREERPRYVERIKTTTYMLVICMNQLCRRSMIASTVHIALIYILAYITHPALPIILRRPSGR